MNDDLLYLRNRIRQLEWELEKYKRGREDAAPQSDAELREENLELFEDNERLERNGRRVKQGGALVKSYLLKFIRQCDDWEKEWPPTFLEKSRAVLMEAQDGEIQKLHEVLRTYSKEKMEMGKEISDLRALLKAANDRNKSLEKLLGINQGLESPRWLALEHRPAIH